MVFVDGQNVYKSCEDSYGHGACHPLLLARLVAGSRRLIGVRYYSGVHDPHVNPKLNARSQRRHQLIRQTMVTVIERKLRYRWEWGIDTRNLPYPEQSAGQQVQVSASPYRRPREKGIDVSLALDVVDFARLRQMNVAVIVSSDNDLCEVARVVHDFTRSSGRVSVEAALFRKPSDRPEPIRLKHYDFTHNLRLADFNQVSDNFDYDNPLDAAMISAFITSCRSSAQPGCV